MFTAFITGVGVGGGLVVAIGAQGAFVLGQAVRREHCLLVAGICALCDVVLITVGITVAGEVAAALPSLAQVANAVGALYLAVFGLLSLRSAVVGRRLRAAGTRGDVIVRTLAVSLLNPHAYVDTILLLGGLSTAYAGPGRYMFGAGAMLASVLWLMVLCVGGRTLAPLLARPRAWRVLDFAIAVLMWVIAWSLLG